MSSGLPTVLILGHSFVRRLKYDIETSFDARAKINFDLGHSASIHIHGVGGRTVQKIKQYDLSVIEKVNPDILILEIGTNDLSHTRPESVGSSIDDFVNFIRDHVGIRVVCVCEVIDRLLPRTELPDVNFNAKATILRQYLSVVLAEAPAVFIWKHKEFSPLKRAVLAPDGVHLTGAGQYCLYRSYRGAILKGIKLLESIGGDKLHVTS